MVAFGSTISMMGGAFIASAIASVYDAREGRIPNELCFIALGAGLILHILSGGWKGLGGSLLAALIAGGIFLIFYAAGGMGAGDVKLMAGVGALSGLAPLETVMLSTVLIGALWALVLAVQHGRVRMTLGNVGSLIGHHGQHGLKPHPEINLTSKQGLRLPFALPIALGCLVTLCLLMERT